MPNQYSPSVAQLQLAIMGAIRGFWVTLEEAGSAPITDGFKTLQDAIVNPRNCCGRFPISLEGPDKTKTSYCFEVWALAVVNGGAEALARDLSSSESADYFVLRTQGCGESERLTVYRCALSPFPKET